MRCWEVKELRFHEEKFLQPSLHFFFNLLRRGDMRDVTAFKRERVHVKNNKYVVFNDFVVQGSLEGPPASPL